MMIIKKDDKYNLLIENKEFILKNLYIPFNDKKDIFKFIKLLKINKLIEVVKISYYRDKRRVVYSNNNIPSILKLTSPQ